MCEASRRMECTLRPLQDNRGGEKSSGTHPCPLFFHSTEVLCPDLWKIGILPVDDGQAVDDVGTFFQRKSPVDFTDNFFHGRRPFTNKPLHRDIEISVGLEVPTRSCDLQRERQQPRLPVRFFADLVGGNVPPQQRVEDGGEGFLNGSHFFLPFCCEWGCTLACCPEVEFVQFVLREDIIT